MPKLTSDSLTFRRMPLPSQVRVKIALMSVASSSVGSGGAYLGLGLGIWGLRIEGLGGGVISVAPSSVGSSRSPRQQHLILMQGSVVYVEVQRVHFQRRDRMPLCTCQSCISSGSLALKLLITSLSSSCSLVIRCTEFWSW